MVRSTKNVENGEPRPEKSGRNGKLLQTVVQKTWKRLKNALLPGVSPQPSSRTGFPQFVPIQEVHPVEPADLGQAMNHVVEPILSAIRVHDWTNVGVVGKRLRGEVGQDSTGRSVSSQEEVDPDVHGIHSVYYDYARFREQALIHSIPPLGVPTGKPGSVAADYRLHEDAARPQLREKTAGTVFIAHGYTGAWQKFDEVAWYLLRAGFNVLIIEHRGHGGSLRETRNPDLVRMRDWHNYVSDYLAAVEHGQKRFSLAHPFLLFGHSMGGGIATALIEKYPDLFDRAVLSSPMLLPTMPLPVWAARAASSVMTAIGRGGDPVPNMAGYEAYTESIIASKKKTGRYEEGSNVALDARTGWYMAHRTPDLRRHTIRPSWDWIRAALAMDRAVMKKSAIARISTPVILFNGGRDTAVRSQAEGLFITRARRASAPVRFYHFKRGHHELFSDMPDITSRYYTMIISFFLGASAEDGQTTGR